MIKYNSRQNSIVLNNNGILLKPSTTKPLPCSSLFCFYIVGSDSQFKRGRHWKLSFSVKWILHFFVSSNLALWLFSDSQSVCKAIIIINYNFILKKEIYNSRKIEKNLIIFNLIRILLILNKRLKITLKWYMYIIYIYLVMQTKFCSWILPDSIVLYRIW